MTSPVAPMQAMQLDAPGGRLHMVSRPLPQPGEGEIRVAVRACGVCRTDLHVLDGDIHGRMPIIPGHEIVGLVDALGVGVTGLAVGQRVGVPWLGHACGTCPYCLGHRENLCDAPLFTGFTRDGGYATHTLADARFCFAIPPEFDDVHAAPLLCAGLIGFRAYRLAGASGKASGAQVLGLYGFGAAAHILAQLALWQGHTVFAFTREGDAGAQAFARALGCQWAGASGAPPPEPLDAAIIFAAVGSLVPQALKTVKKGGRVVCAGIHMSDIPGFPYADLWEERQILSVANLTREDGVEFLALAGKAGIRTHVEALPLSAANEALERLRLGALEGALVLVP